MKELQEGFFKKSSDLKAYFKQNPRMLWWLLITLILLPGLPSNIRALTASTIDIGNFIFAKGYLLGYNVTAAIYSFFN